MRVGFVWALVGVVAASSSSLATDTTVRGAALRLRVQKRAPAGSAVVRLVDAAIAPPFDDPRTGAVLTLNAGAAAGQCALTVELPAAGWRRLGRGRADRGWRYRDRAGRAQGIRRVLVRPGRIAVEAGGTAWPCGAGVPARLPVSVVLRLGRQRWCGAFGGAVSANRSGRFVARRAPPPAACPDVDLTLVNLNILHGLSCPPGTDACRWPERAALLLDWIEAAGCPDVVTLQEVRTRQDAGLRAALPETCGGAYTALSGEGEGMILTRVPTVAVDEVPLDGGFRSVLHARLDHPSGPVDVYTTHLAARLDGAREPCAAGCPAACLAAGAATRRDCQGVQVAALAESRSDPAGVAVVAGDFNEAPGSFVHARFVENGWLDTHLAAGNAECDPSNGLGCTSGRADDALAQLESPVNHQVERIDFVFATPRAGCRIEPAGDADGDGTTTGPFANRPNPFAPACGPAPLPICWPSDHGGAQLDFVCG